MDSSIYASNRAGRVEQLRFVSALSPASPTIDLGMPYRRGVGGPPNSKGWPVLEVRATAGEKQGQNVGEGGTIQSIGRWRRGLRMTMAFTVKINASVLLW